MSAVNVSVAERSSLFIRIPRRILARPYEVRIDGRLSGRFEELDDALFSASIARMERPAADIAVVERIAGETRPVG